MPDRKRLLAAFRRARMKFGSRARILEETREAHLLRVTTPRPFSRTATASPGLHAAIVSTARKERQYA